jgi:hypothetical protein
MAPARVLEEIPWTSPAHPFTVYDGPPRNVATIQAVQFDASLQPKNYEIAGTDPESKVLFVDVEILDSTGRLPYRGDVLIEGRKLTYRFETTLRLTLAQA